jgi:mannosyltransferase OCH1-like enzyme
MTIPKIIHQTVSNKAELPNILVENISRIKDLNPSWDYRLYDDADCHTLIGDLFGSNILEVYLKINPIYGVARADFFRYLVVYAFGGVYLDVKSGMTGSLNDIIQSNDHYLLSHWENEVGQPFETWGLYPHSKISLARGEFQNWFIIAKERHPFLDAVITKVRENIEKYTPDDFGLGVMGIMNTTGPIAYTLAIQEILGMFPHRIFSSYQAGLRYSLYGEDAKTAFSHHRLFKNHYRYLNEPIVPENVMRAEGGRGFES